LVEFGRKGRKAMSRFGKINGIAEGSMVARAEKTS
jgi:hypothetical protein